MTQTSGSTAPQSPLRHRVVVGQATSVFVREGAVAAQLLLTAGRKPRLIVAFAAGNSGAGLWFAPTAGEVHWRLVAPLQVISARDAAGREMHGIEAEIEIDTSRDTDSLVIERGLLGSVRVLRDHQFDGRLPAHGLVAPDVNAGGTHTAWSRDRLDGAAGYRLEIEVEAESAASGARFTRHGPEAVRIGPTLPGTPLRIRLRALTGDEPLLPLPADRLLTAQAAHLPNARTSFEFLAFEEKWLAGSWRFHTYFGRDTLMSLRLLMPVLQPAAIEAALASVIDRLSPQGEVAHEEDIGEFPVLTRMNAGFASTASAAAVPLAQPIFDYKMVDDDFMLLPVLAAYVLDTVAGRERAAAFLARRRADGRLFGACVVDNVAWVSAAAAAFAAQPKATNLVRLRAGEIVGDWRDSADGLAGGVYAYSVNAVLVPAALAALQALLADGVLGVWLRPEPSAAAVAHMAAVWSDCAPALFAVQVDGLAARAAVQSYCRELGLPAVAVDSDLAYSALSLDDAGIALPVMHSDFGFALLFGTPPAAVLEREVAALLRPFPAGLRTDAGLVVANAVFGSAALRKRFGPDSYHGAVVWSWQQAMVAAGLARQLARSDLPLATRAALRQAQAVVWRLILATRDVAEAELWSWGHDGTRFNVEPFGPKCKTADESNTAQLWSTVYLAVQAPADLVPAAPGGVP